MNQEYKITKEDIWQATENGRTVIVHYYPQSEACFASGGRKNFKIRPDDKNPSCAVFQNKEGIWMIQDKGGSDNKARTAIQLVMANERLDFGQAMNWISEHFAPQLLEGIKGYVPVKPQPSIEQVPPQDSYSLQLRPSGKFTDAELACLGYKITQERCDGFGLKPLDSYITPRNKDGKSFRISANENYPMYFYDYGAAGKDKDDKQPWGKVYQPLGDVRFMYYGTKPENFIFGDLEFIENYQKAKANADYKMCRVEVDDEGNESTVETKWEHLIICSGPSDALNVRNASGNRNDYHICWLNSETADLNEYEFSILKRLAKNIYILYDIDETGIANMYRIALRYLEIKIIKLPEELKRFKDRKGKPCKDAKDFFLHFRRPENQNSFRLFDDLVKLSASLQFWSEKFTKTGKVYDINNEQLYGFLQASGYFRIATSTNAKGYTFCHIRDNVVTLIDENAISAHCSGYLLEYIKTHPTYYTQPLANTVHRSNQIRLTSLEKLAIIEPNFKNWDENTDYFFFQNGIFRVSKDGINQIKAVDAPCSVYANKILPHDFIPMEREPGKMPFFDIEYSPEYAELLSRLNASSPTSPEYSFLKKKIDTLEDIRRYRLIWHKKDFSFLKYIYNTGRTYWRKTEMGYQLTESEQAEHDLHFINKVLALGYMLCKHKSDGQPYAVFCMETEQSEEGTHSGGTGKSLFASSLEQIRKELFIDGQNLDTKKGDFMLQGVERGVTDVIFLDDLNAQVDLHKFMPMITGKMVVNPKYVAAFVIEFKDSPKVIFTSNHAIKGFDASLRRRTWFTAFSDYYHADDFQKGLKERSPFLEFGRNLISDYNEEEMNQFYNFMFNCLAVWQKLHIRIQPPMKAIEKRILQRDLSDEFIFWADDYFTEEKLNTLVDKQQTFEDYKATLNPKFAAMMKPQTFKKKLIQYCNFKEWIFNPDYMLTTVSDKERNDIHRKENGKEVYYFYIDTSGVSESATRPASSGEADNTNDNDGDLPIFGY